MSHAGFQKCFTIQSVVSELLSLGPIGKTFQNWENIEWIPLAKEFGHGWHFDVVHVHGHISFDGTYVGCKQVMNIFL